MPVHATVRIFGLPSAPMQEIIAGGTGATSAPPFHLSFAIVSPFGFGYFN
jgi:hypothetical protein